MKKILPFILFVAACSTNSNKGDKVKTENDSSAGMFFNASDIDPTNPLNDKTETFELNYIVWGCACPNWVTTADFKKYQNDTLMQHCFFIEPSRRELELPIYYDPGRHFLKVTGQFYLRPAYPQGKIEGLRNLEKGKVFRYTNIEVLKKDIKYLPQKDTTLNLSYNAIGCTCAQWNDTKVIEGTTTKYYYLEPASDRLVNADNLFDGETLPLKIQVKGQIVSNSGYPTGFNPTKGNPEAATVFRYSKIKVFKSGQTKNGY